MVIFMNNFFIFVKRSPAVFIMLAGILVGTAVVVYAQTDDAEGARTKIYPPSPASHSRFPSLAIVAVKTSADNTATIRHIWMHASRLRNHTDS